MDMQVSNPTNTNESRSFNPRDFNLKTLDYIPVVSIASGIARFGFGGMQLVASAVQSTVALVDLCLHPTEGSSKNDGTYMYNQGMSNMARGSVAIYPILGNITLYVYDHSRFANTGDRIDWRLVPMM